MIKKEDLKEKYMTLTDSELLEILDNKHEYTDLAVLVAIEELSKRNITEEKIAAYKEEQIETAHERFKRNYVDGLTIWQKHFFYFVWVPVLTFAFKQNFFEDGYLLKLRQARYYSFCGFLSFLIAPIIGISINAGALIIFVILIIEFLITLKLDNFFNIPKEKEKNKI